MTPTGVDDQTDTHIFKAIFAYKTNLMQKALKSLRNSPYENFGELHDLLLKKRVVQ